MKLNRTTIFISISSLALIIVLIIQVNWIFQSAKIKEDIFNEKANMVLSKTAEVLSSDEQACRDLDEEVGGSEIQKTDSLFTNYMNYYDLNLNYAFEVKKPGTPGNSVSEKKKNNIYKKRLDEEVSKDGLELNLLLPKKRQFILEEMGTMFITSVILILVVLLMFWRTILLLMKEKKISEHTTDFLNNMTHEFKTPLTNIALSGKMLMRDSTLKQEDKIKHYSGIILEENEKLRMQVEQVLSMTALERGEIPLQKTKISFHEIISNAIKHINIQIESKQGEVSLQLDASNYFVIGDQTHLTNALRNLIDNALKYSGEQPEIVIHTENSGKQLVISISDKGIGIAKEYHQKIFTKFFRVPTGDVHNVKGFGLGLAYVRKIIELHGGSIDLKSEKGKGTNFVISIAYV
ncbi:MAG: HAMP domain-containing histidine kinase [Bacteroidetes bacterium]|nr:MAG: HAMP domain-containing histidine kinase [Bacteroidota bacterium]